MAKFKKMMMVALSIFLFSMHAEAQDRYLMTGAAKFYDSSEFHDFPLPVNPNTSGALTFDGEKFTFHYAGDSCSVSEAKRLDFYLDPVISHAFGSIDDFGDFLRNKFHLNYKNIALIHLLGGASAPLCAGLRHSMIYSSRDDFILLSGAWAYAFKREFHVSRSAEESFDCIKAQSNVEHIMCGNPDLMKMDATVNRGFVDMQLVDSKEISYQDPVRVGQMDWLRNVRNKCTTTTCLFDAYNSRIQYIKRRVSSAYPSYPAEEPDQDGD